MVKKKRKYKILFVAFSNFSNFILEKNPKEIQEEADKHSPSCTAHIMHWIMRKGQKYLKIRGFGLVTRV